MWVMSQDDADTGCDHDWVLTELVADKAPGHFVPALSRVSECSTCGAVSYETPQPDPNRPPLN